MQITLNGQPQRCPDRNRLDDLVRTQYGDHTGLAVAVNGEVVPRGHWAETVLNDGDRLDVFQAVAGG